MLLRSIIRISHYKFRDPSFTVFKILKLKVWNFRSTVACAGSAGAVVIHIDEHRSVCALTDGTELCYVPVPYKHAL